MIGGILAAIRNFIAKLDQQMRDRQIEQIISGMSKLSEEDQIEMQEYIRNLAAEAQQKKREKELRRARK